MDSPKTMALKIWLKPLALVVVLVLGYWVYESSDYQSYLTRDRLAGSISWLQQYAVTFGYAAPFWFIGAAIAAIVAYVPALVVIFIAVCTFGGLPGAIMSAISIYLAVTVIYFIAQWLGREMVVRLAGRRLENFEARLSGRGFWAVLYLRLFFFVLPPINWLLGLSSIRFKHVFWGTVLGTVHHIIVFSWLTDVIVTTLAQGGSLNPVETPALLVPLGVGTVLFIIIRLADRQRWGLPATTAAVDMDDRS